MLRQRLHDEEGVISILGAAAIMMIVIAAALAVDLGRLAFASRDLQGTTDRAAYDAARVLGDLRDTTADALTEATTVANNTLGVQGSAAGFYDSQVVTVRVGDVDDSGTFVPWSGGPNPPTAVEVTNQVWVPFVFAIGGAGGRTVTRTAVVEVVPQAPISIGTTVGTVTSDEATIWDTVVGDMQGNPGTVSLGVAGWQGLVDADVSVQDLFTNLGITAGSPTTALAVDLPLTDLYQALEDALTSEGDPTEAGAISALASLGAATAATLEFTVEDLIAMGSDDVADALTISESLNVQDLVIAGLQSAVANQNQAVTLTVPVSVTGITDATLTLGMIESQQAAVGPARWDATNGRWETIAKTSQFRLQADLDLDGLLNITGLLPTDVDLSVIVDAGRGEAALTELVCRVPEDSSTLDIDTTTAAVGLHLGSVDPADLIDGDVPINPVDEARLLTAETIGPIPVLELDGATDLTVASSTRSESFTGPFPVTTSGGSTTLGLADLLDPTNMSVTATVLGALPVTVEDVQNELDAAGAPVLTDFQVDVIEPILELLGVELGVADTTAEENPDCGNRELAQ